MEDPAQELQREFGVAMAKAAAAHEAAPAEAPPTEITEALLEEVAKLREEQKRIAALLDSKTEFLRLMAPDKEIKSSIQAGKYIVTFTRQHQARIDWPTYVREQMGEREYDELMADKERVQRGELTAQWIKLAKTVRVDVFRVEEQH